MGERKFKHSWRRRMRLFDALVRSVMVYGAEIWGWKKRERLERMQERYIRWSLGVDYNIYTRISRDGGGRKKKNVYRNI